MRTRNSPGTPKREHAGQQARTDAVRVRPRVHPTGPSRARTYGGQGRPRRPPSATYAQVRRYIGVPGQTVCKTVGYAYPGSNPGPATQKPRSEPVTRNCVTGSDAESKRFRRPLV